MVIKNRQWHQALASALTAPDFQRLSAYVAAERASGKKIYPAAEVVFASLERTPLASVKVVILGQDPYHGEGQAHGLSFSVPKDVALPPSLRNIFKELQDDLGVAPPHNGDLSTWADQGVLLLNSVLTVEDGRPGSHARRGWEKLTDQILCVLNEQRRGLVFVLWGAYAQKKGQLIDRQRHLVLQAVHPSPLAAYRGFFGSRPFSQINAHLQAQGQLAIQWSTGSAGI